MTSVEMFSSSIPSIWRIGNLINQKKYSKNYQINIVVWGIDFLVLWDADYEYDGIFRIKGDFFRFYTFHSINQQHQ